MPGTGGQAVTEPFAVPLSSSTGSFLFADPGGAWKPGWRARLVSAPQAAAASAAVEASCLSFWYRMDGPQIGKPSDSPAGAAASCPPSTEEAG